MRTANCIVFIALIFASPRVTAAQTDTQNEPIRQELARLQKQTGLMLISYDSSSGLRVIVFGRKTEVKTGILRGFGLGNMAVSRDGNEVALAQLTGPHSDSLSLSSIDSSIRLEYPYPHSPDVFFHFGDLSWSNDKSKIATLVYTSDRGPLLQLLDLRSGVTKDVAPDAVGLTSQCWSPDDQKIVYESHDGIRTVDLKTGKSSLLVNEGVWPTWSPDGRWIAYLDHKTYRAIHPDGKGRRRLFHHHEAYSPLYWSPDLRFVAYVNEDDFFPSLLTALMTLDDAPSVLRIRRLADGATFSLHGPDAVEFQWVTNRDLLQSIERKPPTTGSQ